MGWDPDAQDKWNPDCPHGAQMSKSCGRKPRKCVSRLCFEIRLNWTCDVHIIMHPLYTFFDWTHSIL